MEKICHEWKDYIKDYISDKYWDSFKENALAVTVELKEIKSYEEALPIIEGLIKELDAQKLAAVGGDENSELQGLYEALKKNHTLYTDKFEIVKNGPTIDIGFSTAEFGVGETGSVCVDNYAYEARIVSMLPAMNIVFVDKKNMVKDMTEAFKILEKVLRRKDGLDAYTGFVTGPSRTSDIERVLTLGVHGPSRFVLFAVDK